MTQSAIRSRFVMTGHVRTHYSEAGGDGPPVVLCHGGGAGSSGEAGFGRMMPLLADRFQIYAPDGVGGFGETDPQAPVPEGMHDRVVQLEAFMDTLCLDRVCLAGNSQGAWVAAKYALLHPDRVQKLALVSSATIANAMGITAPDTEGMRALREYDGTRESMRRVLEALIWDKSLITEELIGLRNAAANRPGAAEGRQAFLEGSTRLTRDPNLRLKFEMKHALPRLTIPTIFIWGENDNFAVPELGRQLEKELPNVPFHWVRRAGHQVQNDQPEAVAKLMGDFFAN
ncbi:MAG TPA: alpha/beta hydrolase [Chloroflexota bacterium]|nr:alpha/beta hydrolase [Chloroflexota bacterium]